MSLPTPTSFLLSVPVLLALLIVGMFAWPDLDAGLVHADRKLGQDKQVNKVEDQRASPSNNYGFSEQTPSGEWSARSEFDPIQVDDASAPVVIAGIRSYAGKGNWGKQLMVESVTLMNRIPTKISRVKLGWIIITEEDRRARKNGEAATMLRGETSFFEPQGKNSRFKKIDGVYLDFVKVAKSLFRTGALSGVFYMRLRVVEVHFEDGSTWQEDVTKHKDRKQFSHAESRSLQTPPLCPRQVCFFGSNGLGTCQPDELSTSFCRIENCGNDPNACYCNLYSCSLCQDADGDGWSDCAGDCEDTEIRRYPGNWENKPGNCSDGVDNDCDDLADCDDFLCNSECSGGCLTFPAQSPGKYPAPHSENCCDPIEEFNCTNGGGNWYSSTCMCLSPIVIDVAGDGFNLTSAASGVLFDAARIGFPEQISWTAFDSDDAWLALDRNENGVIDDGRELFGSAAPQARPSPGEGKNGFRALALLDTVARGGNEDGTD